MKRLTAILLLLACSPAEAEIRHVGTTGQTLYARVLVPPSTYFAVALTEGSSGGLNNYVATDAQILAAAPAATLAASPAYSFTVRSGAPSASAADPLINAGAFAWSGTAEIVPTPQTGDNFALANGANGFAAIKSGVDANGTAIAAKPTADQNAVALLDKALSGHTTAGTAGKALSNVDMAVSTVDGDTPAQVHNEEPVPARTSKLGTRADGVTKAFPKQVIRPGEITQVWVDCSKYAGVNLATVANGASDEADVDVSSIGVYGKLVSIVIDATAADDGDTATITCDATPRGAQVIKVSLDVEVSSD